MPTDADNEMITFSSDEELVEALGSFNGDVFRVYVKDEGEQDATQFDGGYCNYWFLCIKLVIDRFKNILQSSSHFKDIRDIFWFLHCHQICSMLNKT